MKALLAVLTAILLEQGSLGNSQISNAIHNPPPTVLSRAWMMLAEKGPSSDDFTKVEITWRAALTTC